MDIDKDFEKHMVVKEKKGGLEFWTHYDKIYGADVFYPEKTGETCVSEEGFYFIIAIGSSVCLSKNQAKALIKDLKAYVKGN